MQYWLRGPINVSEPFIMSYQRGSDTYFLNSYTDPDLKKVTLFFDSSVFTSINGGGKPDSIPIMRAVPGQTQIGKTNPNVKIVFSNATGLSSSPTDNKAIVVATPPELLPVQDTYSELGRPEVFLAGVEYQLLNSGKPIIFDLGKTDDKGKIVLSGTTDHVLIIPTKWYLECNSSKSTASDGVDKAICSAYCATHSTSSECANTEKNLCSGAVLKGWTNIPDCIAAIGYQYCSKGTFCSSSCKGPCSGIDNSCLYDTKTASFKCQFDPSNLTKDWWKQPWFIFLMVFIIIIFIGIFILIMFLIFRKRSPE